MENWDEIRTAFQVARMGTVSGAAEVMGVHHATVIRHIDALEKRLGTKLFQRHARGYTPTEAGRDLLAVAQTTEERFGQLVSRIKGHGETVSGELVVTAITGIAGLMVPVFAEFQAAHPAVNIRFLTDMRLFRLDYGEAHVAIRAGAQPELHRMARGHRGRVDEQQVGVLDRTVEAGPGVVRIVRKLVADVDHRVTEVAARGFAAGDPRQSRPRRRRRLHPAGRRHEFGCAGARLERSGAAAQAPRHRHRGVGRPPRGAPARRDAGQASCLSSCSSPLS